MAESEEELNLLLVKVKTESENVGLKLNIQKTKIMPSNHLILSRPLFLLPSIIPSIRVFPMSQFFTSVCQNIGVSASASFLPMNNQD